MNAPRLIDRLAAAREPLARLLLDDPVSGIVIADNVARILGMNATARQILGPETGAGHELLPRLAPAERARLAATLERLAAGSPPERIDLRIEPAGGATATLTIIARPIIEENGTRSGFLLQLADTSAQRRLEQQLAHGEKLQAIGQLAGGIAHDFNNLLATIRTAAELAREHAGHDGPAREDINAITAAAERGAALVRQLLAFARRQALQPSVLSVGAVIAAMSALLRRVIGPAIRLDIDPGPDDLLVRVDPTQLDRILLNLAVNASHAMQGSGVLRLHCGHVTLYRALTRGPETIPPGRYAMIEVADTGPGIPPDILPRIFEPFFTTRRDGGGTGLGLAIVHGIVRQSDGFLTVESEPGQGTRFRIYLPRPEGAEPPVHESPAAPPRARQDGPGGAGRRILLVDDEAAVRAVTARALARRGWRVDGCDSAESALALLRESPENRPDILISDVLMPGMDGLGLVRAARALYPGLPAILVSGYSDERLRDSQKAEKILFLSKPYELSALMALLESGLATSVGTLTGDD